MALFAALLVGGNGRVTCAGHAPCPGCLGDVLHVDGADLVAERGRDGALLTLDKATSRQNLDLVEEYWQHVEPSIVRDFALEMAADLRASLDGEGPYREGEVADLISRLLFGIVDPPH